MRTFLLDVRITRSHKCKEGFYMLVNGIRLHFKTKSAAMAALDGVLRLQRIQIVTVREFQKRQLKGDKR